MRRQPSQITEIIIHCAATPNGKPFTTADIDRWHAERGFKRNPAEIGRHEPSLKAIGYHYVIYINGAVASGRHELETGAHTKGHNSPSIGVCMIGTDKFTRAQWTSLQLCITSLKTRYPRASIHGHREFSNKICPGFDVQKWLENNKAPLNDQVLELPDAP